VIPGRRFGKTDNLTVKDSALWDKRFQQQVRWTNPIRRHLLQACRVQKHDHIIEVGCGSGALLEALSGDGFHNLSAIDLDLESLHRVGKAYTTIAGNALQLPFLDKIFDHTFCHFFLMWSRDPHLALNEMRRVTKPGGWVIAFAEPDYGGRLDFPPFYEEIGKLQVEALMRQNADVSMGRKLRTLFSDIGLQNAFGGIIGMEWGRHSDEDLILEWKVLVQDLLPVIGAEKLNQYKKKVFEEGQTSKRFLYVPICFAAGQVPDLPNQ